MIKNLGIVLNVYCFHSKRKGLRTNMRGGGGGVSRVRWRIFCVQK